MKRNTFLDFIVWGMISCFLVYPFILGILQGKTIDIDTLFFVIVLWSIVTTVFWFKEIRRGIKI